MPRRSLPRASELAGERPTTRGTSGALDHHDVYTAILAAGGSLGLDDVTDAIRGEQPAPGPRCEGLTGAAVGVADDGDPLIVLALTQASGGLAGANALVVEDILRNGDDVMTERPCGWRSFLNTRAFPPC